MLRTTSQCATSTRIVAKSEADSGQNPVSTHDPPWSAHRTEQLCAGAPTNHSGVVEGETEGEALGLMLGEALGLVDGLAEGLMDGLLEGLVDGDTLGEIDGDTLGDADGLKLGETLGLQLGEVDGMAVGDAEGEPLGETEGLVVGDRDGLKLGLLVGDRLGLVDGLTDGDELGALDGEALGLWLGDADGDSLGLSECSSASIGSTAATLISLSPVAACSAASRDPSAPATRSWTTMCATTALIGDAGARVPPLPAMIALAGADTVMSISATSLLASRRRTAGRESHSHDGEQISTISTSSNSMPSIMLAMASLISPSCSVRSVAVTPAKRTMA